MISSAARFYNPLRITKISRISGGENFVTNQPRLGKYCIKPSRSARPNASRKGVAGLIPKLGGMSPVVESAKRLLFRQHGHEEHCVNLFTRGCRKLACRVIVV